MKISPQQQEEMEIFRPRAKKLIHKKVDKKYAQLRDELRNIANVDFPSLAGFTFRKNIRSFRTDNKFLQKKVVHLTNVYR